MRVISSFELYTFNMILLLVVALSILDLCAGSRRSLMDPQPLPTSVNATAKNCLIPLQKFPDFVQVNHFEGTEGRRCNTTPCILQPGHAYIIQISFTPDRPVHNGSLTVEVYHGLKWRTSSKGETSLCRSLSPIHCPLKAGRQATFYTGSSIPKIGWANLYKVSTTPMRFSMRDGRDELLFCFVLTGRIPWSN